MSTTATTHPKGSSLLSAAYQGGRLVAERLAADTEQAAWVAICEDLGVDKQALQSQPQKWQALDVTTDATVDATKRARAVMVAKSAGVIAGLEAALRVFQILDDTIIAKPLVEDGTVIEHVPFNIAEVEGPAKAILIAERSALNLIQRLSGIATATHRFVDKAAPRGIAILDTRKTTPGLRTLEKYAVQVGGGVNHRYGLFDAILIKDNHVRLAGGITAAIQRVRAAHPQMAVQVEVTDLTELKEALSAQAEKVILDNMHPAIIKEAVTLLQAAERTPVLEISGGVNYQNIDDYLIEGVDAISIGALTHALLSLDISLEIEV